MMARKQLIYAALLVLGISACTPPVSPPSAPTGLTATPGARSVTLNWDANSEADLTRYNVYFGSSEDDLAAVAVVAAGTETYVFDDLLGFQEHSFAVTAQSPSGESALSTVVPASALQTGFEAPGFFTMRGDSAHHLEAAYSADLNPTTALTIEGWVRTHSATGSCPSLVSNGFTTGFWVGVCDDVVRSYTSGGGLWFDAGSVPLHTWVHFAVTSDGVTRKHYIDGTLAAEIPESEALTTSTNPVTIGTAIDWIVQGVIDLREVRIWSIARTQEEIQATMSENLTAPEAGLEAVWPLTWDGRDALGARPLAPVGSPMFGPEDSTDEADPTMPVAFIAGGVCTGAGAFEVHYQVMPFYVEEDGTYAFSSFNEDDSIAFYIMETSFDPADPIASCLAAQNIGNPSYVTANLTAGDYLAVIIDDTFAQDQTLEFSISVAGPL